MTDEKEANLEERILKQDVTTKKFPKKLSAYCDIEKKETIFEYAYTQPGYGVIDDASMYTCTSCPDPKCRNTKAYQTLMTKFNGGLWRKKDD